MENNLKDRYIYAVTRHLPTKIQADVEIELDSLISDMLNERDTRVEGEQYKANTPPTEQDIKDIIKALGPPEELALKYYGSERKALISGIYFLMYKRVLRTVLPIVAAVLAVFTIVGFIIGIEMNLFTGVNVGNINIIGFSMPIFAQMTQLITSVVGGVVQVFAVITVVFAILEYFKVDLKSEDFYELPEVPEAKMKISPSGPIFGIAFAIITTVIFLGFPEIFRLNFNLVWIPVFDAAVIRGLWLPIVIWTILEVGVEIVKLVEGQYTMRVGIVGLITGILSAVFAFAIFGNNNIVNQELLNAIEHQFQFEALGLVISNPNIVIMIITLVIIFFDTLDVVVKSFQSRRA